MHRMQTRRDTYGSQSNPYPYLSTKPRLEPIAEIQTSGPSTHLLDDLEQVIEPPMPVSLFIKWGVNSTFLKGLI